MNLLSTIQHVCARLEQSGVAFGHGTSEAFDEACWLVLWRLGLPLDDLDAVADRAVSASERAAIDALIDRRIGSRKPAAYLTGEAWLQGVPFHVDERVIVPRSLIAEVLAEGLIDPWLPSDARRMLDLCTGNGSLAVLAAMAWPGLQVDASDVSSDALDVARLNVTRHGLGERIRLIESDGLAALRQPGHGPYDLILCNPPYVNRASMATLPPEFRAEPSLALDGGDDGMDFVRPLLSQVGDLMTPQAVLVLEIGHERTYFERAFPGLSPLWLETSAGADQVLLLERSALMGLRP